MSIQSEITRLESAKSAIAEAIAGKGVTVPDGTLLDGMAALIEAIEAGGGIGETQKVNGSFTPASNVKTVEIEHNLGVIPKCIIWLPYDTSYPAPNGYNGIGFYLLGWTGQFFNLYNSGSGTLIKIMDITLPHDGTNDGDSSNSIACNATINKVTLGNPKTSTTFKSGVKYFWCIVG